MTLILSLDPACERNVSDTGWCLAEVEPDSPAQRINGGVIHGGFDGFVRELYDCKEFPDALQAQADVVICEQFVSWEPKADSTPRLIEGIVRYLRPDAVLQPSSGYKTAVPDEVLKRLGFWTTNGHHADERSAARHLIMYLKHDKHLPTLKEGWPS